MMLYLLVVNTKDNNLIVKKIYKDFQFLEVFFLQKDINHKQNCMKARHICDISLQYVKIN